MSKYRIVKREKTVTKDVDYYIEVRRKFFKWTWWVEKTYYHGGYDIELRLSYKTIEEAKEELDELNNKVISTVVRD
jgi:hypothetical protein